jgi:anti-anti-sigma regulatory factor
MTYRIHRAATADTVMFSLSGDMDLEHTTRLQEFLATEADGHVTLDLKDVSLVHRAAVRFLAAAEAAGVRIVNCPEYVRSWIEAEKDWHETNQPNLQEPRP